MKPIFRFFAVAALTINFASTADAGPAASVTPTAVPDSVLKAFKAMEGRHLGTITTIGLDEWNALFPDQKNPKSGARNSKTPGNVDMGRLEGVFPNEPEAIRAARVSDGTEVLKRAKGDDGKYYYAIFEGNEFAYTMEKFAMNYGGGRFAIVEQDKTAEEKFKITHDVRKAVHQANEVLKRDKVQPSLRRYDSTAPVLTKLSEVPEN